MAATQDGNVYTGDDASDAIKGSGGNDYIHGNIGGDILKDRGGDDYIDGGVSNDDISGDKSAHWPLDLTGSISLTRADFTL